MSELLRIKQGDHQVTKKEDGESERNDCDEVVLHGLPQLLAGLDVEKRQGEEDRGEQQHPKILHRGAPVWGVEAAWRLRLPYRFETPP
jgi:hypothetical protein